MQRIIDSEAPVTNTPGDEGAGKPPRRRYVKRRKAGASDLLDIAFEPLVKVGRGRRGKRLPAADLLLAQTLERAAAGSVPDLRLILKHDEANRQARAAHEEKHSREVHRTKAHVRAMEAGLILDILVLDLDLERQLAYWGSPYAEFFYEPWLNEWTLDPLRAHLQQQVKSERWLSRYYGLDRFVLKPQDIDAEEPVCRQRLLAELKAWRQPSHHHWSAGTSGRSIGRRGFGSFAVPFPYLEELVILEVEGRAREMTRTEALICQLQHRARNGDGSVARALAPLLAKRQLAQWASRQRDLEPRPPDEPGTVFEAMRRLGMTSKRARKTCLLEHWLVSLALERLGQRRLTADEQAVVTRATRRPHDGIWPEWWAPRLDREHAESRHVIPDTLDLGRG